MTAPRKFDSFKPRLSLIAPAFLTQLAQVLQYGEEKYGPANWLPGMDWSRMSDAAMRHILAFQSGQDIDPETGRSHLIHAAACLMMLHEYTIRQVGEDDRRFGPTVAPNVVPGESDTIARVIGWANSVFPNRTAHDAFAKLVLEEIPEIVASPKDPLEWADAYILLVDAAHLNGVDILKAVGEKMTVNEGRKWRVDPATNMFKHMPDEESHRA